MAASHASGRRTVSRSQLPGWARAGLVGLGRTGMSGTLHRDRDTPLPSFRLSPLTWTSGQQRMRPRGEGGKGERGRIVELERSILFLRAQHMETLQHLHTETEQLKRENRELSFQLIMCRCGCRPTSRPLPHESPPTDQVHILFLQKEVEHLRQALAEEKRRNGHMLQLLQSRLQGSTSSPGPEAEGNGEHSHHKREATTTLHQGEKEQKAHEARAYVPHPPDTPGVAVGEGRAFQRVRENVTLPALKPSLAGGVAERQRRCQAVKKRPPRTGLPLLHSP